MEAWVLIGSYAVVMMVAFGILLYRGGIKIYEHYFSDKRIGVDIGSDKLNGGSNQKDTTGEAERV